MKRTTAITVTVIAAFVCGLPSLLMICIGALALLGAQLPEASTDAITGAWIFICCGGIFLFIPILIGIYSFRLNQAEEGPSALNEPLE